MAKTQARTKPAPSSYSNLAVYLSRCAQLLSSLIVASILYFFIYHLSHENMATPWTFVLLATATSLTFGVLIATTFTLHFRSRLNSGLDLAFNGALSVLWAAAFASLTWWASGTVFHACNAHSFIGADEAGRLVCRLFKALYAFAALGTFSILSAFVLGLYTARSSSRRGTYAEMSDADAKVIDAVYKEKMARFDADDVARASATGQTSAGYAVPQEQFAYDTSYAGPDAERIER